MRKPSPRRSTTIPAWTLLLLLSSVVLALPAWSQGVPGADKNKCLAGKTQCVAKKVAGLLKCRERCQKNPKLCGPAQQDCEAKVNDKYDGGDDPSKGCFARLENRENPEKPDSICTNVEESGVLAAEADQAVATLLALLETPLCPEDPFRSDLACGIAPEGTECSYWEETCCIDGTLQTFTALECFCISGTFSCGFTDACLLHPPTCNP